MSFSSLTPQIPQIPQIPDNYKPSIGGGIEEKQFRGLLFREKFKVVVTKEDSVEISLVKDNIFRSIAHAFFPKTVNERTEKVLYTIDRITQDHPEVHAANEVVPKKYKCQVLLPNESRPSIDVTLPDGALVKVNMPKLKTSELEKNERLLKQQDEDAVEMLRPIEQYIEEIRELPTTTNSELLEKRRKTIRDLSIHANTVGNALTIVIDPNNADQIKNRGETLSNLKTELTKLEAQVEQLKLEAQVEQLKTPPPSQPKPPSLLVVTIPNKGEGTQPPGETITATFINEIKNGVIPLVEAVKEHAKNENVPEDIAEEVQIQTIKLLTKLSHPEIKAPPSKQKELADELVDITRKVTESKETVQKRPPRTSPKGGAAVVPISPTTGKPPTKEEMEALKKKREEAVNGLDETRTDLAKIAKERELPALTSMLANQEIEGSDSTSVVLDKALNIYDAAETMKALENASSSLEEFIQLAKANAESEEAYAQFIDEMQRLSQTATTPQEVLRLETAINVLREEAKQVEPAKVEGQNATLTEIDRQRRSLTSIKNPDLIQVREAKWDQLTKSVEQVKTPKELEELKADIKFEQDVDLKLAKEIKPDTRLREAAITLAKKTGKIADTFSETIGLQKLFTKLSDGTITTAQLRDLAKDQGTLVNKLELSSEQRKASHSVAVNLAAFESLMEADRSNSLKAVQRRRDHLSEHKEQLKDSPAIAIAESQLDELVTPQFLFDTSKPLSELDNVDEWNKKLDYLDEKVFPFLDEAVTNKVAFNDSVVRAYETENVNKEQIRQIQMKIDSFEKEQLKKPEDLAFYTVELVKARNDVLELNAHATTLDDVERRAKQEIDLFHQNIENKYLGPLRNLQKDYPENEGLKAMIKSIEDQMAEVDTLSTRSGIDKWAGKKTLSPEGLGDYYESLDTKIRAVNTMAESATGLGELIKAHTRFKEVEEKATDTVSDRRIAEGISLPHMEFDIKVDSIVEGLKKIPSGWDKKPITREEFSAYARALDQAADEIQKAERTALTGRAKNDAVQLKQILSKEEKFASEDVAAFRQKYVEKHINLPAKAGLETLVSYKSLIKDLPPQMHTILSDRLKEENELQKFLLDNSQMPLKNLTSEKLIERQERVESETQSLSERLEKTYRLKELLAAEKGFNEIAAQAKKDAENYKQIGQTAKSQQLLDAIQEQKDAHYKANPPSVRLIKRATTNLQNKIKELSRAQNQNDFDQLEKMDIKNAREAGIPQGILINLYDSANAYLRDLNQKKNKIYELRRGLKFDPKWLETMESRVNTEIERVQKDQRKFEKLDVMKVDYNDLKPYRNFESDIEKQSKKIEEDLGIEYLYEQFKLFEEKESELLAAIPAKEKASIDRLDRKLKDLRNSWETLTGVSRMGGIAEKIKEAMLYELEYTPKKDEKLEDQLAYFEKTYGNKAAEQPGYRAVHREYENKILDDINVFEDHLKVIKTAVSTVEGEEEGASSEKFKALKEAITKFQNDIEPYRTSMTSSGWFGLGSSKIPLKDAKVDDLVQYENKVNSIIKEGAEIDRLAKEAGIR